MSITARPTRRKMIGMLLAGVLASAGITSGIPSQAEAADVQAESVEILTAQIPVEGSNIASGRAVLVVDRPIEEVLPVILDYGNYVQFMPNFTKSRVLAQRGSRAMVYMEVSIARGMYTLYGQLNLAEQPQDGGSRVVKGRLMDGNLHAFDASFTLTPVDDGARTEIDFNIYVDPDIPLPSAVFSKENERAAGKAVRALHQRIAETPGGSA